MSGRVTNFQQGLSAEITKLHNEYLSNLHARGLRADDDAHPGEEGLTPTEALEAAAEAGLFRTKLLVGPPGSGALIELELWKTEGRYIERAIQLQISSYYPGQQLHIHEGAQCFPEGRYGRVAAVGATIFYPGSGFIIPRGEDSLRI
jgi:hypothetical protein